MIVFCLDALADDSHRRHFIDKWTHHIKYAGTPKHHEGFIPDYASYNAACDGDKPIKAVISIWDKEISLGMMGNHQIWSSRCDSVRDKTLAWLDMNLLCFEPHQLKMRPFNDHSAMTNEFFTPQENLFNMWLDEFEKELEVECYYCPRDCTVHTKIEMVFSSHKPTIKMFRKRGVFVFDCNQEI